MSLRDLNFWLNEKDLKTPEHDKMVLWTFNNIDKILKDLKIGSYSNNDEIFKKIIEYPIVKNNFNIGFIDLYVYSKENSRYKYAFEIKPNVKSIGEVLRQFQFYKSNLQEGVKLILITSTKGLKEIFESQGFYVIEYQKIENDKKIN